MDAFMNDSKYSSKTTEFHAEHSNFNPDVNLFKQSTLQTNIISQFSQRSNVIQEEAQELKKLLKEKKVRTRQFFKQLANDIMKLPETQDEKEKYLRAISPADYTYIPKLPKGIQISRLGRDKKGEFIPDYITDGLKQRHDTRFAQA